MNILDRPQLSPIQPSPGLIEDAFHYTQAHPGATNVSDSASQSSRKSFYGGCGYSKDYFRNLTGDYLRPSTSGVSPSSPNLAGKSGLSSPGRNLLHPGSGSPASEASKSPQRSPRSQRQPVWGLRSFQNPIGSVYHDPDSIEWSWAGGQRPPEDAASQHPSQDAKEDERPWTGAGRNLLPYEALSGANYPGYWVRPGPGDNYYGNYVSTRTPPRYTMPRYPVSMSRCSDDHTRVCL